MKLIRRIYWAIRFELQTREDLEFLRTGGDPDSRLDLFILKCQMRFGKSETPLWRVIWEARKEKPLSMSAAHILGMMR